jgi:hypothetical protein
MKKIHYLAFVGCLLLVSCHSVNQYLGLQDDNFGEELIEEVVETAIQVETGYRPDLDFTP